MSSIVFDSGPIISLTTNSLLWLLENLKKRYEGYFYISKEVQRELVTVPIQIKKFKLEALEVNREINKGVLTVIDDPEIQSIKQKLSYLANNTFFARGIALKIVQEGEMGTVAAAIHFKSDAIVIDERTTRELIENPDVLSQILEMRLHTSITVNKNNLEQIKAMIGNIKVIRSIELAIMGYELGWFDKYLTQDRNARKILIEAILWGIKMRGASISQQEIDAIVRLENK